MSDTTDRARELATFVEQVCKYGAPEGRVLCQKTECKHAVIVHKLASALQRERDEVRDIILEMRREFSVGEYYSRMKIQDWIDKVCAAIRGPEPHEGKGGEREA
jgi:hypothetical protein